ncbi:MAG: hypothetical protein WC333_02375 [Dehalococcoidia bacterium]|jgi:2-hydroxychromene-2-carboxylate isomerase
MNKTSEEILQEEYTKFAKEKGVESIFPREFPLQYKEAVLRAMKADAEQEAKAFANWLSHAKIGNKTIDQLWKDYQIEIS